MTVQNFNQDDSLKEELKGSFHAFYGYSHYFFSDFDKIIEMVFFYIRYFQ